MYELPWDREAWVLGCSWQNAVMRLLKHYYIDAMVFWMDARYLLNGQSMATNKLKKKKKKIYIHIEM